jgi:hypothetical protein
MNVVQLHPARDALSDPESAIYFKVVERELHWKDRFGKFHVSPDHKQLVRPSDTAPIPLAVVGNGYKVVQNYDLFSAIERDLIDTLPPEKLENVRVNDSMSYSGAFCCREYIFADIFERISTDRADTTVAFRAIVVNGFGSSAIKIMVGAIDWWCSNGIVVGTVDRKVQRHTSGLSVTKLSNYITKNTEMFSQNAEQWRRWATTGITLEQAEAFFRELVDAQYLSDRLAMNLNMRYRQEARTRGGNLWALASALTYYSSHADEAGGFGIRDTARDHRAATLVKRGEDVRRILGSGLFRRLAA